MPPCSSIAPLTRPCLAAAPCAAAGRHSFARPVVRGACSPQTASVRPWRPPPPPPPRRRMQVGRPRARRDRRRRPRQCGRRLRGPRPDHLRASQRLGRADRRSLLRALLPSRRQAKGGALSGHISRSCVSALRAPPTLAPCMYVPFYVNHAARPRRALRIVVSRIGRPCTRRGVGACRCAGAWLRD